MELKEINNCFIDMLLVLNLYNQNNSDLNKDIKTAWKLAEKTHKRKWRNYRLNLK